MNHKLLFKAGSSVAIVLKIHLRKINTENYTIPIKFIEHKLIEIQWAYFIFVQKKICHIASCVKMMMEKTTLPKMGSQNEQS